MSKVGNTYAKGWFLCDQPFAGEWHLSYVDKGYDVKGWQCKNQPLTKRRPTICTPGGRCTEGPPPGLSREKKPGKLYGRSTSGTFAQGGAWSEPRA